MLSLLCALPAHLSPFLWGPFYCVITAIALLSQECHKIGIMQHQWASFADWLLSSGRMCLRFAQISLWLESSFLLTPRNFPLYRHMMYNFSHTAYTLLAYIAWIYYIFFLPTYSFSKFICCYFLWKQLCIAVHTCNPSPQEVEAGG